MVLYRNEPRITIMLTTRDLSAPERLLVDRRRKDLNQEKAASHWKVTPWTYRMWEEGKEDSSIPFPALGKLKHHESCVVLHRRSGLKRTELAKLVGVSGWWLTCMENGIVPVDRLVEFWHAREENPV